MNRLVRSIQFCVLVLFSACNPKVDSAVQFRAPYREHLSLIYVDKVFRDFHFPEGIHYALMTDEQARYMES